MKKYLISGIGPGPTGVGRLMNHLVEESTSKGYTNIYNFASKPARKLLDDKKYIQLIVEGVLRFVHYIIFYIKINRIHHSEIILIYPQGIGLKNFKRLIQKNKKIKIYIMDNSFFCMKSYNYLNGECLQCLDDFENYDSHCSPEPRPYGIKEYINFLYFLKFKISTIKLFAQSESHKILLQRVYGQEISIEVIGMNTGEFNFESTLKSCKMHTHKKTIIFHNHLIDSKGFDFALAIATRMKQYDFIFPSKKPKDIQDCQNIQYIDINWDDGLKELVINADLILCLSMWSTPIEGALVKSIYYNGNVAVMDNLFGFNTEIPNNIVLKLGYDLPKAIETIDTFMKNDTLDLSQESMLWLKKLYSSYDISKLFIS